MIKSLLYGPGLVGWERGGGLDIKLMAIVNAKDRVILFKTLNKQKYAR